MTSLYWDGPLMLLMVLCVIGAKPSFEPITEYWEWPWCQLCHHWWHQRLPLWQPIVPSVITKLASWQLSVVSDEVKLPGPHLNAFYEHTQISETYTKFSCKVLKINLRICHMGNTWDKQHLHSLSKSYFHRLDLLKTMVHLKAIFWTNTYHDYNMA